MVYIELLWAVMSIYRTLLRLVTVFCYMFIILVALYVFYLVLLYLLYLAVVIGSTVSYTIIMAYSGAVLALFMVWVVCSIILNIKHNRQA